MRLTKAVAGADLAALAWRHGLRRLSDVDHSAACIQISLAGGSADGRGKCHRDPGQRHSERDGDRLMKDSNHYSAQELAVMSWEELLAQIQIGKKEQFVQPGFVPSRPSTPPGHTGHEE